MKSVLKFANFMPRISGLSKSVLSLMAIVAELVSLSFNANVCLFKRRYR